MLTHLNYKEMYKPSNEDLLWAKNVYDTIIMSQVLAPQKVKEAYQKVFGIPAPNFQQAKIKLFAYFTHTYKKVDETETADILPDLTAASTTGEYTHSEDIDEELMTQQFINDVKESGILEESTSLSTETSTPQSHSEDEVVEGIVIPEGSFEKECHSDAFAKVIDGKIVYDNTLPKNGESETQVIKPKRKSNGRRKKSASKA